MEGRALAILHRLVLTALAAACLLAPRAAMAEPTRFDLFAGKMIVPVALAGRPARAIIDTGASRTLIDQRLAARIGASQGRVITLRDYVGAPLEARTAPPALLTIGGVRVATSPLIADLSVLKRYGEDVAIILGNDVLATRLVSIDFDRGELELHPAGAPFPLAPADALVLTRRANQSWAMPVQLAGVGTIAATLDLGSDAALSLAAPPLVRQRLMRGQTPQAFRAAGLNSEFEVAQVSSDLDVAGARFDDAPVALLPPARRLEASLGLAILQRFNLVLDLTHDRLWATPNSRFALDFHRPVLGFSTDPQGLVLDVTPNGPASAAGLRRHDRVLAMYDRDRQPVHDVSLLAPGDRVSLLLSTGAALSLVAAPQ